MLVLTRKQDQSITLSPRCGASPRGGDLTSAEEAVEKDLIEITVHRKEIWEQVQQPSQSQP